MEPDIIIFIIQDSDLCDKFLRNRIKVLSKIISEILSRKIQNSKGCLLK